MKKIFLLVISLTTIAFSQAQTNSKKPIKFTPPIIVKDKEGKAGKVKFTPPIIKKNKPSIKPVSKVKFTPPVIVKDGPTSVVPKQHPEKE